MFLVTSHWSGRQKKPKVYFVNFDLPKKMEAAWNKREAEELFEITLLELINNKSVECEKTFLSAGYFIWKIHPWLSPIILIALHFLRLYLNSKKWKKMSPKQ